MNKKDLPAVYSTAFWCLFVVLLFFWLYCVTAVTPFIEPSTLQSMKGVTASASHADVLTGSSRNHSSKGTRDEPLRTFAWEPI